MQALISPDEKVFDYDGNFLGARVAEVEGEPFPVAPPLFWIECPSNVVADQFYWLDGQFLPVPLPPPPVT